MKTEQEIRKRIEFDDYRIKLLRASLKDDSQTPVSSLRNKIDEIDQLERERSLYMGLLIS